MSREIQLLICPIPAFQILGFDHLSGPNHVLPFRRFQHWAIRVGDIVYEVAEIPPRFRSAEDSGEEKFECSHLPFDEWNNRCRPSKVEILKLGLTNLSDAQLRLKADLVWEFFHMRDYALLSRNCHSFAVLFDRLIRVRDEMMTLAERKTWKPFPKEFSIHTIGNAFDNSMGVLSFVGGAVETVLEKDEASITRLASNSASLVESLFEDNEASKRTTKWIEALKEEARGKPLDEIDDLRPLLLRTQRKMAGESFGLGLEGFGIRAMKVTRKKAVERGLKKFMMKVIQPRAAVPPTQNRDTTSMSDTNPEPTSALLQEPKMFCTHTGESVLGVS
ncbi:hypothetical protein GP486_000625 [Trichoglossum hirsutum]|uniref:PPPDE domain-containing protein n=1 Tax=Trichoglossum hirsutum TaxID=265104 RepID=A0A9P8LID1_9PEZI|nr:hypothetical protein GP486_000625 [Trichoglossum hirsutum]